MTLGPTTPQVVRETSASYLRVSHSLRAITSRKSTAEGHLAQDDRCPLACGPCQPGGHNTDVSRLQRKNFGAPEHTRDLGRGRMDVVDLDETAVGRMILKP